MEAEVEWLPTQRLTIYGTLSRRINETGGPDGSSLLQTGAAVRADYELYHNLLLNVGALLREDEFCRSGTGRRLVYGGSIGIDYYLNKNWLFTFSFQHDVREFGQRFARHASKPIHDRRENSLLGLSMSETADDVDDAKPGGGAMSLERAVSAVRKRLKLVLALPVVFASLTALIVLSLPNRYDASALVQIDPRHKLISNLDTVVSDLKGDMPTVESEVEVIRSRPVILSVIETLNLRNDPEFRKSHVNGLLARLGLASGTDEQVAQRQAPPPRDQIAEVIDPQEPGSSVPERDEVAVAFAERLKVVRVRTTLLIDIRFSASDAVQGGQDRQHRG